MLCSGSACPLIGTFSISSVPWAPHVPLWTSPCPYLHSRSHISCVRALRPRESRRAAVESGHIGVKNCGYRLACFCDELLGLLEWDLWWECAALGWILFSGIGTLGCGRQSKWPWCASVRVGTCGRRAMFLTSQSICTSSLQDILRVLGFLISFWFSLRVSE